MSVINLEKAKEVFASLAADERIPHAMNADMCAARRELMLGLMIKEHKVPVKALGRITVIAPGSSHIAIPYSYLTMMDFPDPDNPGKKIKIYESERLIRGTESTDWGLHTAPTVTYYDKFADETRKAVFDPTLNAHNFLTEKQFVGMLHRRLVTSSGKISDTELIVFASRVGIFPKLPEKVKYEGRNLDIKYLKDISREHQHMYWLNGSSPIKTDANGIVPPATDWDKKNAEYTEIEVKAFIELLHPHTKIAKMLNINLLGNDFTKASERLDDWATSVHPNPDKPKGR